MTGKWFMQRDNKEYGPYDLGQLEQFAREKRLLASDLVKEEGGTEWFPAAKIPGLFGTIAPAPPNAKKGSGTSVNKKQRSTGKLVAIIVGSVFVVMLLVFAGIFYFAMSMIRNSEPYSYAMSTLQSSQEAISILGEPIKDKTLVTGQVSVSGPSGEAEFAIPVYGPVAEGTVYVIAEKSGGKWHYEQLELASESGKRISLIYDKLTAPEGYRIFDEPGYGYQLIYPDGWYYEIRDHIVLFIGPEETVLDIQTLFSTAVGGLYEDLDHLLEDFTNQYFDMGAEELGNFEEHLSEYAGEAYRNITFYVIYHYEGDDYWSFVWLMERDQEAFHAVIVTIPLYMLEDSDDVFPAMLESFTLVDF